MPHTTNETLRKSLHIGFGAFAFALKLIPWQLAAVVAACAVLGNWLLLHRLVGKSVAREARGYDAGIVLYPLAVLVMILAYRHHPHYAAIAWVILAVGDGVASLAGRAFPIARLPWNADKSWGGVLAFILFGSVAAIGVAMWMDFDRWLVVIGAVIAAAIVESLALGVNDNITVPFAAIAALVIGGMQTVVPYGVWPHTPVWLGVNALLAIAGYFARSVNVSGAIGGWLLGTIIIFAAGWPMYATLLAFFVIGSAVTKLGYQRKAQRGLAQEKEGRRGFSHAFSNVGMATLCAVAVSRASRMEWGALNIATQFYLMGIASLATAAADTTASEIGQLIGRRAFLPLTLRRVEVGTEGAISIEGTAAGAIAGLIVAFAGVTAFDSGFPAHAPIDRWLTIALVAFAAFLGSYLESLAGNWNRKRMFSIPNGVLNFFNTLAGAVIFYITWRIVT